MASEQEHTARIGFVAGMLVVMMVCLMLIVCCHESESSFRHAVDAGRPAEIGRDGNGLNRVWLAPDGAKSPEVGVGK